MGGRGVYPASMLRRPTKLQMTRRTALTAGFAALTLPAHAEDGAFQLFWSHGRYLPYWRTLSEGAERRQYAAFLGDEATALADAASGGEPPEFTAAAHALPAIDQIVAAAAARRVVILNEAHVASRHRGFFSALARALRPVGFTHIACEDFLNSIDPRAPNVAEIQPNAPLPSLGYYIHDPVYAEAIREAALLGYRFVAYEQRSDQQVEGKSEDEAIARREQAQASNFIANALSDANTRILVYVGYSHLREEPDAGNRVWFAQRLKEQTGLDPLTIEQSHPGSFGPHAPDGATAQMVLERFRPTAPIVVDEGGRHLHGAPGADIVVYHPSLPDVRTRPGWLAADPTRRFARVRLRRPAHNLALVQAIHADDPDGAIPADQFLLGAGQTHANFLLRPGRYRIRIEVPAGHTPVRDIVVQR